jgi:hypothetical protein
MHPRIAEISKRLGQLGYPKEKFEFDEDVRR